MAERNHNKPKLDTIIQFVSSLGLNVSAYLQPKSQIQCEE